MKFLFFLIAALAIAQDSTGGIRGTVVDSTTHQPIRRANVSLQGGRPGDNNGTRTATTDASGGFAFDTLAAGAYVLLARHDNYPQNSEVRKPVDVKAGEIAGPILMELAPGAAVTGVILDEDGDPLTGCAVQAHPASRSSQGVPQGSIEMNENAEFRVYDLPPGPYTFSATCNSQPFQPRPFSSGPDPPSTLAYPQQFYPLTIDAKSAQVIDLAPGSEKAGIDFRMRPAAVTRLHGSLSSTGADWHGQPVTIRLIPADSATPTVPGQPRFDPQTGVFDFPKVFSGSYLIFALSSGDADRRVGAVERIEVKDRPVEVVLTPAHGIDIQGSVEIESNNPGATVPFSSFSFQLSPEVLLPGLGQLSARVNPDWTFGIRAVMPGQWRLTLTGPGAFLKSAWLGSADVAGQPFNLSGGGSQSIRIVISTNLATITGTAPAGQSVFAAKMEEGSRNAGRGAVADASGHFTIGGLAPGRYRVIVLAAGEALPDEGGQEIAVREGETVSVELNSRSQ